MKYTAKEWDEVRMGFSTSIMVETSLKSLAQNLDALDWPLEGADEKPSKYIDLTFEELVRTPGLSEHPERVEQLVSILKETLAFDNPFGDMVEQAAVASEKDNPLQKNIIKLEIPIDFPIELTQLSADAKDFCKLEKLVALGDFANFAQNMSPQVIVGGDFRTFLNALAHVNEEALAGFLPFRVGGKGLHLPEALAQLVAKMSSGERLALCRRFGARLNAGEEKQAAGVKNEQVQALENGLRERAAAVIKQFKKEFDEISESFKQGGTVARQLVVLNSTEKEFIIGRILTDALREAGVEPPKAAQPEKKGGLFSRWFKR